MNYAINVADLTRHAVITPILLGPVTQNRITANAEPKMMDGMALVLQCDEKRARAICQILRDHDDRLKQYRTRVYIQKNPPGGAWTKVKNTAILVSKKELQTSHE